MKLLIAIPTVDYIHFEFVCSLVSLTKRLAEERIDFDVIFEGQTLVYMSRNTLANKAVSGGYSHILWLDADMVFNDDIFDRLYRHNKSFVTAICHARRAPYASCLYYSLQPPKRYKGPDEYPKELFKVGGCGFACVLIETDIFRKLRPITNTPFTPNQFYSEDLTFCRLVTDLHYDIWADPTIPVGHISHKVIYPDDYQG